ncbi:unnamed protein product [Spirodela intermedia]|uniref:Uncharacterized protein n=2 Tax=Spirodela intermedia TaxID=51605 RepID=A0A7I8LJW1_SPIIN|nr:unnamed protein product [Spirodela intermedia]CAA6672363.1 unnamed protein product [Spirodela intermedia]CAA7409545.1 unnamed protein product [Spirodela intermedia]
MRKQALIYMTSNYFEKQEFREPILLVPQDHCQQPHHRR